MITYGASASTSTSAARPGQASTSVRLVRDVTRIQQGGREITYEWSVPVKALPQNGQRLQGPEFGQRWALHLNGGSNAQGHPKIGFFLDPILTPAEDATCCRRQIDAILNVWLNDLDRPLRTRSLTTRMDEGGEQYGWNDCVEQSDLTWSSEITTVIFELVIREPSILSKAPEDSQMDIKIKPQRVAATVIDCCDPRALPDVHFNIRGRSLIAFSGHLRYSNYLTKLLDSPFAAFPLDEGLRMFPEGELDLPTHSADSPASTSSVTLEDLQAEDSDREDEADLDDEPPDNPAFEALKPFMKQIEVKDFSFITFRALLQYGHSGILTFAPLSSTFRKSTLPRLKKLVMSEVEGKKNVRITRLNAAAVEHASSTFGPFKAISCSPKSMYRIARVHNAPLFTQKCFDAIVAGWCPEAVLEELSLRFYRVYAAVFLPKAKEFLVLHWEEISASSTFGADLAAVFASGNAQLIEAVTTALGSLRGDKESKRRRVA